VSTDNDKNVDGDLTSLTFKDKKAGVPYEKTRISCPRDLIMDPNRVYRFAEIIASIVEEEGPVLKEVLLDRIRELSKVGRIGTNIQSNFERAITLAVKNKEIEKNTKDKGFFYKPDTEYTSFRTPGDGVERRLSQISAIEIRNAIQFLIKNQFGLAYDNMIQSVKPLFGINRADPEETDRIKDIVDEMIAQGTLVKHGPLLNLMPK
jgi:hypothetical protein